MGIHSAFHLVSLQFLDFAWCRLLFFGTEKKNKNKKKRNEGRSTCDFYHFKQFTLFASVRVFHFFFVFIFYSPFNDSSNCLGLRERDCHLPAPRHFFFFVSIFDFVGTFSRSIFLFIFQFSFRCMSFELLLLVMCVHSHQFPTQSWDERKRKGERINRKWKIMKLNTSKLKKMKCDASHVTFVFRWFRWKSKIKTNQND